VSTSYGAIRAQVSSAGTAQDNALSLSHDRPEAMNDNIGDMPDIAKLDDVASDLGALGARADLTLQSKLGQTWCYVHDGHCTCPPGTSTHTQRQLELLDLSFAAMAHVAYLHFGKPSPHDQQPDYAPDDVVVGDRR
jgi:hypothetical protein